ncbi:MAG: hypothetical protein K0U98_24900 [Deltaproteobacteria bacterium]|nr:hypothetical protein [Deltaproteobacteria bacterium]
MASGRTTEAYRPSSSPTARAYVKEVKSPPIRHINVAPTLAHLTGLPAPAKAVGRVLDEALTP